MAAKLHLQIFITVIMCVTFWINMFRPTHTQCLTDTRLYESLTVKNWQQKSQVMQQQSENL